MGQTRNFSKSNEINGDACSGERVVVVGGSVNAD